MNRPLLVMSLVLLMVSTPPGAALGAEERDAAGSVESAGSAEGSGRLLDALAYAPLDEEGLEVRFTDWARLKARHGDTDVTSGSPLEEREAVLAEISQAEAATLPATPDPETWSTWWGWDSTDLDWQVGWDSLTVLRFRDDWDLAPFAAGLERHGYEREDASGVTIFRPGSMPLTGPETATAPELDTLLLPPQLESRASVVLSDDGRTAAIDASGDGPPVLGRGAGIDPRAVAGTPLGRVAARLDRALAAVIRSGDLGCSGSGEELESLRGGAVDAVRSTGRLHPYSAYGAGYAWPSDEWPSGRYVFDYDEGSTAKGDLDGRDSVLRSGVLADGGDARESRVDLALLGATVDGRFLQFDVIPQTGEPGVLFDRLDEDESLFGICGPHPAEWQQWEFAANAVPQFVGPATLTLAGGPGTFEWDEVHFGADKIRVVAVSGSESGRCTTQLRLDDGDRVIMREFGAKAGSAKRQEDKLKVDYATAGMRVETTCDSWSLQFEPIKDPKLKVEIENETATISGSTLADLAEQLDALVEDGVAWSDWTTSWHYSYYENSRPCVAQRPRLTVEGTLTLPLWEPPEDVDPRVAVAWLDYIEALQTHHQGHLTIALQGGDAVAERLAAGVSAKNCYDLGDKVSDLNLEILDRWSEVNDRYNEQTDSGRTQGVTLDG